MLMAQLHHLYFMQNAVSGNEPAELSHFQSIIPSYVTIIQSQNDSIFLPLRLLQLLEISSTYPVNSSNEVAL